MHGRSWGKMICYTDGGLHIEMSMLKVIDDWLDESGYYIHVSEP